MDSANEQDLEEGQGKSKHNSTHVDGEQSHIKDNSSQMKHKSHEEWVIRKEHENKLKRQLIIEAKKDILERII